MYFLFHIFYYYEIGPENVIQFMTDDASNHTAAGSMMAEIYPHIFKINCATHCINLMFKMFLKYVSPILEGARKFMRFVYGCQHVLDYMRFHTSQHKLKRSGTIRYF